MLKTLKCIAVALLLSVQTGLYDLHFFLNLYLDIVLGKHSS